jgi:hypothetical protein
MDHMTTQQQEQNMGYTVIADKYQMDQMRDNYGPRRGLEGPFNFSGRVLYYDVQEGKYYDPRSDFYVEQDEMNLINARLMNTLRG